MKYDLNNLTLEEKIELLTGADNWRTSSSNGKLRQVFMSDGPNGLRMQNADGSTKKATAMPNLSVVAQTWDEELAYLDGETIANDCIDNGADVLLAPGVNVKRTPLNGRNFEYLSEDPYLAGVMARAYIRGVQSKGVGTSLKHYCANNREVYRFTQTSEVDERALHEIYLKPFEIATQAEPWTVMCSYNPVNGVYASENRKLLKDTLRDKFGYKGLIVSDWGAVHEPYKSLRATLDLCMPHNGDYAQNVKTALENGYISMKDIDFCVQNVLNLIETVENAEKTVNYTKEERHANALKIAEGGMVLLKNEDEILPLKDGKKYLVAGYLAKNPLLGGGGSAFVQTDYPVSPLCDLLKDAMPDSDFEFSSVPVQAWEMPNELDLQRAKYNYLIAREKDAVILYVGDPNESECYDRSSIRLHPGYERLIKEVARYNENVIVLLNVGSAVDMSEWIDDVKAVLLVGYAGEAINEAAAAILSGKTNPSGKLAETFPLCLEDTYTGDEVGDGFVEWYSDGVFVGYRHYDRYGIDVLFPFGYGLSYSKFKYDNLKIEKKGDAEYEVSYDITNVSDTDGAEVSQIYVKDIFSMVVRPEKELRAFNKSVIKAGETKRITVKLGYDAFAYYSTVYDAWHVENGPFEIWVGASSADIRLKGTVEVELPDDGQQSQI